MLKRKVKGEDLDGKTAQADTETAALKKYPSLVAQLTVVRYADGTKRSPGRLSVVTEGSVWKVEVKDPDTCSLLRVTQARLDDALKLLDALVGDENTAWEVDQWAMERAAGKKKKK